MKKPDKKSDAVLWNLISSNISAGNYFFVKHARKRLIDRNILDIDVLDILENKNNRGRKRNKSKDTYKNDYQDWNYCIEGLSLDREKIRIIISFDENLMVIITVIRLDNMEEA